MCLLCDNWDSTSYSKRPTTDISTNTGHELLLLGYYLGVMSIKNVVDPAQTELSSLALCPEHEAILQQIADFKDKQQAAQVALAAQQPPAVALGIQQGYKDRIAKLNVPPLAPAKPIPRQFTAQELIRTARPELTSVVPGEAVGPVIQPIPPAAGIDPTFKFECPTCLKQVTNGEIHDCVYVPR